MVLVHNRRWPAICAATAIAAWLLSSGYGWADVPAASYRQKSEDLAAPPGLDKLLSDAQRALSNGELQYAVILLKNAVSLAPKSNTARLRLANALVQKGETSDALIELRTARQNGAADTEVLPLMFQVMLARGENQAILDQFREPAGTANPVAADILMARAIALQNLRQNADALATMDRSLSSRRDVRGLITRARLSLKQNDFAAATKYSDEAIQLEPNNPDAMLFKVELLFASKENSAALDVATEVATKFPKNLWGRAARVIALMHLNQDQKAKAEVDKILAENPNLAMGVFYKALLMFRSDDKKGAWGLAQSLPAEFLDSDQSIAITVSRFAQDAGDVQTSASILARCLKNNPDQLAVRVQLAAALAKQNNISSALTVLRPLQDSNDPRAVMLYSAIYLQMGRPKDSLNVLKRLDAAGGGDASVKQAIALLELQSGITENAIADLTRATEKDPTNASLATHLINALIQKQRFEEALKVSDGLAASPKQLPTALALRGAILFFQRNIAGAQRALDKAIALDPRNKPALYTRAALLESIRNYPEASRDLNVILSFYKGDVAALTKLAEIAISQGDEGRARALLAHAIASAPQAVQPRLLLVKHLVSRKDYTAALSAANDCVRAQSDIAECLLLLAKIQEGLGKKKEAVANARRFVGLNSSLASAWLELGGMQARAGDRAGAEQSFDTAVRISPDVPAVKRAQISLLFDEGKNDAAMDLARKFQASYPGTNADLLMADALQQAGHSAEAADLLRKSLSARPQSVVLMRLVRDALASNNMKSADELMSRWLANHPRDIELRLQYAAFWMQQNDNSKAMLQYQMVLKQDKTNVTALNNLGWLIQKSDPKRAIALLTHAWELSPNVAEIADSLGWLRVQQKDVAGGLKLLQRAHELRPVSADITYHLVVALDLNSNRKAARELLKTLLASGTPFADRPAALDLSSKWR